jgi:hypothetical protein
MKCHSEYVGLLIVAFDSSRGTCIRQLHKYIFPWVYAGAPPESGNEKLEGRPAPIVINPSPYLHKISTS